MRKNPADRFPSMRDFAKALTSFLNDSPRSEKTPKQAAEVDARAVETIEFEPPKVSRPKHATPAPMLPARPRRGNRPRQQKQKRSPWPPAALAVGVITAVLVVGVVIGTLIVRRPGSAAVARTSQVASDANGSGNATTTVEPSIPVRTVSKGPGVALSAAVPAPTKNTPASNSVTAPVANRVPNSLPTTAASGAPPSATAVGSTSTSAIPPIASSAVATQPKPVAPSTVSKPAVLPSTVVSNPPAPATTPAATVTASGSGVHSSPASARAPGMGDASSSPADEPDSPPVKARQRRGGGQPPDDAPPPGGPGGRRPFDGGPARGMTIEAYFKKLDVNRDGKLDPSEIPMHIILRGHEQRRGADAERASSRLQKTGTQVILSAHPIRNAPSPRPRTSPLWRRWASRRQRWSGSGWRPTWILIQRTLTQSAAAPTGTRIISSICTVLPT